jgi:hypothetical protein
MACYRVVNFTFYTNHRACPDPENILRLDTDPIFLKSEAWTLNISLAGLGVEDKIFNPSRNEESRVSINITATIQHR